MAKHIAFSVPYDLLVEGLELHVSLGNISIKEKGVLRLYNYSPQCTFEKCWNVYTRSARGLVLNTHLKKVENLGLPKFWNWGEFPETFPIEQPIVYNKLDGSCVMFYFSRHENRWACVTRGSFESDQAKLAEYLFYGGEVGERVGFAPPGSLDPSVCYVFELIAPENRIVINYGKEKRLRLLAAYNRETGEELDIWEDKFPFAVDRDTLWINSPLDPSSIESLIEKAKTLPSNEEGFVLHWPSTGQRVKIKGEAYCALHKMISRITPLGIWDLLILNKHSEALKEIPEEFLQDAEQIIELLIDQMMVIFETANQFYQLNKDLSRKEYALLGQKEFSDKPRIFSVAMQFYLGATLHDVRQYILKGLRPTGNILPGYEPTSVRNRFERTKDE